MLNALIVWSARNKFLVVILTLFITLAGIYAVVKTPLDALPDLSDVPRSSSTPNIPARRRRWLRIRSLIHSARRCSRVPKSKVVRGFSFFGASFVYVIFEDGTDMYWARSRVLEYLNFAAGRLPKGVTPSLGPDATGVGWVYQYVVLRRQRRWRNCAPCRTGSSATS
jgi:Cu(I)/Ag(I) efflux system membrane protein CusA/SilA